MSSQHAEFSARIARIESGAGSSKSTLFVGADEVYRIDYGRRRRKKDSRLANAWYPVSVALTFVIGAASDLIVRWIDWMTKGVPPSDPETGMQMVAGFFTALFVSMVLGACLGVRVAENLALRAAGILSGMIGWHNAVHQWPEVFQVAFSPLWVATVTRLTEPHSLVWMGNSISF